MNLGFLGRVRQRSWRLIFSSQHPWRRVRGGLIVGVVVGVLLGLLLWQNDLIENLSGIRTQLTDMLHEPRPTDGITVIIAMDDASLMLMGVRRRMARSVHTNWCGFCRRRGARDRVRRAVCRVDRADAELAAVMSEARNVVEPVAGSWTTSEQTTRRGEYIEFDHYEYPTPVLREASRMIGHVNIVPDGDGQVREVPLVLKEGDQLIPALGLAAYMQYIRHPMEAVEIEPHHVFANRDLYTDDIGQMVITFFGEPTNVNLPGTYPVYSFVDVVEGRVPPEVFNDKIVLIGTLDSSGNPDSYATPSTTTGKKMYGVEIHANIIETIHQSLPTVKLIQNQAAGR
jgi:CHASE2 domain-containing sensor protein